MIKSKIFEILMNIDWNFDLGIIRVIDSIRVNFVDYILSNKIRIKKKQIKFVLRLI